MLDLSRRATDPELLDEGVPEDEARRSLADIRFVNRWLGGCKALLRAADPYLRGDGARPRLLDVGSGSADLPSLLVRSTAGRVLAVAVDIKLLHLREAPADVERVVADVRALPFGPGSFDVVTANLFLHHFDGAQAADVLRTLYGLARRALIVNDLRRAWVPYVFGRLTFPLLFRSYVSVEDGLLSIRRAFTRDEMASSFADAGIPHVQIRRSFPYRLVADAARP
jgi:2-polyprenyl-3-methyl-5-hydroxy-6-metoxy-1,4-benzoquinol methylase